MGGKEKILKRPKDIREIDLPVFADFLEGMLAIEPDKRKSAAEMLQLPRLVRESEAQALF
ncbi:hypothetical protein LOZ12_000219, partial [Ophidiomyces ophidiicola]